MNLGSASLATILADADKVFAWAEKTFPAAFAPTPQTSNDSILGWRVRAYSGTGSYLGVNTSGTPSLYYLGPVTNNVPTNLGPVSVWLAQASVQ